MLILNKLVNGFTVNPEKVQKEVADTWARYNRDIFFKACREIRDWAEAK